MVEEYVSDRPIETKEKDEFQRYGFAKKIAEAIINRKNKDSIVFGINGTWGVGKTSLINLIKSEISEIEKNIIQISFNPWRFPDETSLLTSFFNSLALNLKLSESHINQNRGFWKRIFHINRFNSKDPLKTQTENIGDLIQKYGKLTAVFGIGDVAESLGKIISNVDIDTLKTRIEKLLESNHKKIVIYLDDIDRLDKSEIHSVFRLVKLTADFPYIVYVLAFDEEMVASAIGERFGNGDKQAGENFLEKIIQVPLHIPKAQPEALKKFCFQLINNTLNNYQISLKDEEVQRFAYQFTTNLLGRLKTPRLAVRYGNSLSISLPLLKEEVNIVDLLLIEAVSIFYPTYYKFIKKNPEYFVNPYTSILDEGSNNNKINEIKSQLENLGSKLTIEEDKEIRELLIELFPILSSVFNNTHYPNEKYNEWFLAKRIGSKKYFEKYFTYSVIAGEISDSEFELLIQRINQDESVENVTKHLTEILKTTNPENLIHKFRSREGLIDWKSTKIISKAICNISEILPYGKEMFLSSGSPFSQSAIFIRQLLKNNKNESDLFQFIKELLRYGKDYKYAFELFNWLRPTDDQNNEILNKSQYSELAKILIDRGIKESKEISIIENYPQYFPLLSHQWYQYKPEEYKIFVEAYLNEDKSNIIKFLIAFVPSIRSSSKDLPYKGDITQDGYKFITSYNNAEDLYKRILTSLPTDELDSKRIYWNSWGDKEFTEINMLRQFVYWYQQENNNSH